MKKIILLLSLLVFPMAVKADMGMPEVITYEAIVTAENGADVYYRSCSGDGRECELDPTDGFNAGEKIKIQYEEKINGEMYGIVYDESDRFSNEVYIKLSDIRALKNADGYSYYNYNKDEQVKFYVYDTEVNLYKGPAVAYGLATDKKIPIGETLTATKTDGAFWYYVSSSIGTGWVYHLGYNIELFDLHDGLAVIEEKTLLVPKDLGHILNSPSKDANKVNIMIPKNTELKSDYYTTISLHTFYHVSYKGVNGWISGSDVIGKNYETRYFYPLKDRITVYSNYDDLASRESLEIKKYKLYEVDYVSYEDEYNDDYAWYRVSIDAKHYWYNSEANDSNFLILDDYSKKYEVINDTDVYDFYRTKNKVGTLKKGEVLYFLDFASDEDDIYYGYIKDVGWVLRNHLSENETDKEVTNKDDSVEVKKEEKKSFFENIDTLDLTIYCVSGAVVLAITTMIIIKLVNKKKEKKRSGEIGKITINENNSPVEDNKQE